MSKRVTAREIDKTYREIESFMQESKSTKEKIAFKRKQLEFLKAKVAKKMLPFKEGLQKIEAKKERRRENVLRKQLLEQYRRKIKK